MDLKTVSVSVFALLLFTSGASAEAAEDNSVEMARAATIDRIESAYTRQTLFAADSPVMKMMLAPARRANPTLSNDELSNLALEVAPALSQVFTEKGGLYDTLLRASLTPLSQPELERLEILLSDPVYRKFQAAMAAPSSQQKFMQAIMGHTARMTAVINEVLTSHGLKEVH